VNICGDSESNWKERIIDIDLVVPHNAAEGTLRIFSTSDKDAA
jgi:hypothetical protein